MLINDKTVCGKLISEIPWYSRDRVINRCLKCGREDEILLYSYNKKDDKDTCRTCFNSERNNKHLTDEDKIEIKSLYENGEIIDKIAKIIKKPEHRISTFLNEIGYIKNALRIHFNCSICSERLTEPSTSSICKKCISIRETTYRIDISIDEFFELNKSQSGLCKICSRDNGNKRLSVDHCHSTGKVRGLLCGKCNTAIGFFKDDASLIKNAIEYIKNFNQNLTE